MNSVAFRRKRSLGSNELLGISFTMYMCMDLLVAVFRKVLGIVGLPGFALPLSLFCVYVPLFLTCIASRKAIEKDVIFLFGFLVIFFMISYLLHPDYEQWYTRSTFGVWDYVFRPDNGLYIFLFIRLLDDPRSIFKYLKAASVLMILYNGYRLIPFLRNGYWTLTYADGSVHQTSYYLEYGYDVLLYELTLLYAALREGKLRDWLLAGAGFAMIMVGGSRGPFLGIMVFLALYFWIAFRRSRKKIVYILITLFVGVILFVMYQQILAGLAVLLENLGISSRIIKTLIAGTVGDDNGRNLFWNATIDMIRSNPFGYGAMGTRHVLYVYHTAGYPHNFFLELIADFGVFIGGGLSIYFVVKAVSLLRMDGIDEWKGLFLIFMGMFCQLMISATFYHRTGFWGLLAIGISAFASKRRSRRGQSGLLERSGE